MDAPLGWLEPVRALKERQQRANQQWASFGPYYAMFPLEFARGIIRETTREGDGVLDPFAGRGTTAFCAGELGRRGFGIELNPVGWLYATTKLNPAAATRVLALAEQLAELSEGFKVEARELPRFFGHCFAPRILHFLLAARANLNWQTRRVDATLMAIILNYLHGKIERGRPSAFSNQMRQTKCMAPDYSMRWWLQNGFEEPPDFCPIEFLRDRVVRRYRHGSPAFQDCHVRLGDCRTVLPRQRSSGTYRLLLTSPPYCGVTSYYYDQWLRLWMLGYSAHPTTAGDNWKGKFEDRRKYEDLLLQAFRRSRRLLTEDAIVYVRTDAREVTLSITKRVLLSVFPDKKPEFIPAPFKRATQTFLFGDKDPKPGEYDIILTPK
jgi:hypothetical protein